jgi:hypothetical protein
VDKYGSFSRLKEQHVERNGNLGTSFRMPAMKLEMAARASY